MTTAPHSTNLLTPSEVADLLRVSLDTLARWRCRRINLAFCRLGRGGVRYQRDSVLRFLADREQRPAA